MKFLVLGASGMAGHLIAVFLHERGHQVLAASRSEISIGVPWVPFDATGKAGQCGELIADGDIDIIVNCVGVLNQSAEERKAEAAYLNAYFPHWLADMTKNRHTRIIHLSTDCVFSGQRGHYKETDVRDGTTFYDRSKALGELNDAKNLTFRNSIVGPDRNPAGIGLFNWFMRQTNAVKGYTASLWNGVTTLHLAKAIERAAVIGLSGLYQLVPPEAISKHDLLVLFSDIFTGGRLAVHRTEGIVTDKTLVCTRGDFPFEVPNYDTMLAEMHGFIVAHRHLYPQYRMDE